MGNTANKEIINCLFCNSTDYNPVRGQDIVKCNSCGNVYLRERKTKQVMEQYYSEVYAVNNPGAASPVRLPTSVKMIDNDPEYIYAQRKWILDDILNKYKVNLYGKSVIDIGCGWGGFLYNAKKLGMNVSGFEFNNPNVEFGNNVLNLNIRQIQFTDADDILENSVDIIAMNHVLEHVPNPKEVLHKIQKSLTPNGIFFCMVPNFDSFLSDSLQDSWSWIEREDHYTHFTPEIFKKILPELGFEILDIFTTTGDYDINVLVNVLKHIYPDFSNEKYQQIIDELNKMGKGEQINLFARKSDKKIDYNQNSNKNSSSKKRLLWSRSDSIGDNIISAGMIDYIQEHYKEYEISVLCQDHIMELYNNIPYIKNTLGFNRNDVFESPEYQERLWNILRAHKFDLVINSVYSRDELSDYLALNIQAKETIGSIGDNTNISEAKRLEHNKHYTRIINADSAPKTEVERHKEYINGLGINCERVSPKMWLNYEDELFATSFYQANNLKSENTITIFPSAQSEIRLYKYFNEILENFTDYNIIILGGKDSVEIAIKIKQKFKGNIFDLSGKLSILKSAAIIKKSALLISTESAGSHIATAVGTKNVVIVGGGHFGRFMPYSNLTSVVCLPLECYGCNWKCQFEKPFCIDNILPQIVSEAVFDSLENDAENPKIYIQGKTFENTFDKPEWKITDDISRLRNIDFVIIEDN